MRLRRIAAVAAVALIVLAGIGATLILWHQRQIIASVLATVEARTGVRIVAPSTALRLGARLYVILDDPELSIDGREVAKFEMIRAALGWRAIIFSGGVPLRRLTLDRPEVTVPSSAFEPRDTALRHPDERTIQALLANLGPVSAAAQRVDVVDAVIRDADGELIADDVDLSAKRAWGQDERWHVEFDFSVRRAPLAGARVAGDLMVGPPRNAGEREVAGGRIWFWDAPAAPLATGGIEPRGSAQGKVELSLAADGGVRGTLQVAVRDLMFTGPALKAPLEVGELALASDFSVSAEKASLSEVKLERDDAVFASGAITVERPYDDDPRLALDLQGLTIELLQARAALGNFADIPREIALYLEHLNGGAVTFNRLSLAAPLSRLRSQEPAAITKDLAARATLKGARGTLPADLRLPPFERASGVFSYASGVLTASQVSVRIGRTVIDSLGGRVDLSRGAAEAPYQTEIKAELDLEELYPAAREVMQRHEVALAERIKALAGRLRVEGNASGHLRQDRFELPHEYSARLVPERSRIELTATDAPIEAVGGAVVIDPRLMRVEQIVVNGDAGSARIDGDLRLSPRGAETRGIAIELDAVPAEKWLPLVVERNALDAKGPVSGRLVVKSDPSKQGRYLTEGDLGLADGSIQFGFLRAPLFTRRALLALKGDSLELRMDDSTLEGSPIDFRLAVADLAKPVLDITAAVERLDFETMTFIRMPWSPRGEPAFFDVPAKGHVEVRRGNLAALQMQNIKTDFVHDAGEWKVYNFNATSYRGQIDLELSGRKQDYWLNMKGKIEGMDVGPLLLLSQARDHPPMTGKIWLTADLWADTGEKFFSTMAGSMSVTVRDGRLDRFTLLSRLLGLIDIKSWLTARIPDPTRAGLPFEVILGDFEGRGGVFWTENFIVHGPVMDIAAKGSIDVDRNLLDMEVGMFPFRTVNWLIEMVPIVGWHVAGGTEGLVAAYVQVSGPLSDPKVVPKPITSVTEFVKKFLAMPINVIRPKTVK